MTFSLQKLFLRPVILLMLAFGGTAWAQNAATVNGVAIPQQTLNAAVANFVAQGAKDSPQLRDQVLIELIAREALVAEGLRLGLDKSPAYAQRLEDARRTLLMEAAWSDYLAKNPITEQPTTRNPVLLSADRGELPVPMASFNLEGLLKGGGIALACNLAFGDCVRTIAKNDKVDDAEARKRALTMLAPGVVLQPSGVFATIRAQEAGCQYLKAS